MTKISETGEVRDGSEVYLAIIYRPTQNQNSWTR